MAGSSKVDSDHKLENWNLEACFDLGSSKRWILHRCMF